MPNKPDSPKILDELNKLNIEGCSDSELKTWIKQAIPVVIAFIQASRKLFAEEFESDHSPCNNCNKAETCKHPCDSLEAKLPGAYSGSQILNKTCSSMLDFLSYADDSDDVTVRQGNSCNSLKITEIPAPDSIFHLYENCQWKLSKKQWDVVYMKFKLGKQNVEIAVNLGISQSSVCDRLRRARKTMEQHYKTQKDLEIKHVISRNNT